MPTPKTEHQGVHLRQVWQFNGSLYYPLIKVTMDKGEPGLIAPFVKIDMQAGKFPKVQMTSGHSCCIYTKDLCTNADLYPCAILTKKEWYLFHHGQSFSELIDAAALKEGDVMLEATIQCYHVM